MASRKGPCVDEQDVLNRIGDALDALSKTLTRWIQDWASRGPASDELGLAAELQTVCGMSEHIITGLIAELAAIDREHACLVFASVRALLNVKLPPVRTEGLPQFDAYEVCESDGNGMLNQPSGLDDHTGTAPAELVPSEPTTPEEIAKVRARDLSELDKFCRYISNHRKSVDEIDADPDDLKGLDKGYARQLGAIQSQLHAAASALAVPTLSDNQVAILGALLELEAFDSDSRQRGETIANETFGPESGTDVKHDMVALKEKNLVKSAKGRGGGYWLTAEGKARVKKLQQDPT